MCPTHVWVNVWFGENNLGSVFLRMHHLEYGKECQVLDWMLNATWCWN